MAHEEALRLKALDIWQQWKGWHEANFGPLREADILSRIRYILRNQQEIQPPTHEHEIAEEAISQSFASEIAEAIGWNAALAVLIATRLLEEVNCHYEAAALRAAAQRVGTVASR